MTPCYSCKIRESKYTIWSVYWIDASCGPIYICPSCLPRYVENQSPYIGQQARERFESIKKFIRHDSIDLEHNKKLLVEKGECMKYTDPNTLLGKVLIYYKKEYWIVMKYSVVCLGLSKIIWDETS